MGPSWTGNLAWKMFSQILLYAAYSIGDWGLEAPLIVNFLDFFTFSESSCQKEPENA